MNEDKKFSKEKSRKRASGRYQKKSQGEKLKSETSAKKAYGYERRILGREAIDSGKRRVICQIYSFRS